MYYLTIKKGGSLQYEWLTLDAFITRNSRLDYNEPIRHSSKNIVTLDSTEWRTGLCDGQYKNAYHDLRDCIMLRVEGSVLRGLGSYIKGAIEHGSDNCFKLPYLLEDAKTIFFTCAYNANGGEVKARVFMADTEDCVSILRPLKVLKLTS